MSSFLSALAPKVEVSFADIVDEVHRLREENAQLRTQVGMLCTGGAAPAPERPATQAEQQEQLQRQQQQEEILAVADARADVTCACLASELARLEASAERGRLQEAMAREELAMRCEELGRALEQRVLQAEQKQAAAVAAAQQQSAAAVAALEEQLTAMTEEAARREALAEAYGADSELAEAERRAIEAVARCEHKAAQVERLHAELEEAHKQHATQLGNVEAKAAEATAAAAGVAQQLAAKDDTLRQMEGQLVRLSEGFNKQVEEVVALQRALKNAKTSTVDKAMARSWLVTYVEAGGGEHGEELLQLMAESWEFTKEDLTRVGLAGGPHPDRECQLPGPNASLAEAFASFLELDDDDGRPRRPPPRSPHHGTAASRTLPPMAPADG